MKLFFLIIITSCASNYNYLENGNKFFNNEMYQKALNQYSLGLKKDPSNVDYQIKIQKTREKLYEKELIKVRNERLKGNVLSAIKQVRLINQKTQDWNIKTNYDGSSFQNNEIKQLFFEYKKQYNKDFNNKFYLKIFNELNKVQDVFHSLSSYQQYKKEMFDLGKMKCNNLQNKAKQLFQIFVEKYCSYFGIESMSKTSLKNYLYNFKGLKVLTPKGKFTKDAEFNKHKLFDNESPNNLFAISNVQFSYSNKSYKEKRKKDYFERESFWDYENKTYFVNEPYWTTEMQCNYSNQYNPCRSVRVQKYRMATRQKRVKVKKYKNVSKTFHYEIGVLEENLFLTGVSKLYMNNKQINIRHDYKERYKDEYHNHTHRQTNIEPDRLIQKDINEWQNTLIEEKIITKLHNEIEYHWKIKYCKSDSLDTITKNNIIKCSVVLKDHPFLNTWSLSFSGLNYSDMSKILENK